MPAGDVTSTSTPSGGLGQPRHAVREADVEIGRVAVFGGDRCRQFVLLVLQHEGKADFVLHRPEIEFGHHRMRDAVVKPVRARYQPERNDLFGDAEIVEHLQRGRMQRSRALVLDRRGLLLEHRNGDAELVEGERTHHADRPCPDNDDPRVRFRCRHAGICSLVYCVAGARSPLIASQFCLSAAIIATISSGVLPNGSKPVSTSLPENSLVFTAAATSLAIASTPPAASASERKSRCRWQAQASAGFRRPSAHRGVAASGPRW